MKWVAGRFQHIPEWYAAAFERLPDILARELTSEGWMGGIDWAQMDYIARNESLEELTESIKRWGDWNPRISALLKSIQSERGAGTPAAVESRAGGST